MRYAIVIEKAEGNFSAYVPDLPGCVATGATVPEIEQEMREAIRFHIEGLKADGLPVPLRPALRSMLRREEHGGTNMLRLTSTRATSRSARRVLSALCRARGRAARMWRLRCSPTARRVSPGADSRRQR